MTAHDVPSFPTGEIELEFDAKVASLRALFRRGDYVAVRALAAELDRDGAPEELRSLARDLASRTRPDPTITRLWLGSVLFLALLLLGVALR